MVAVKAIIKHDGKILLMQNAYDNKWQLPGGRMNVGERPVDCLRRELQEEFGAEIEPVSILKADTFESSEGSPRLLLIYVCNLISGPSLLKRGDQEVKDFRWVSSQDIDILDIWPAYITILEEVLKN